MRIPRSLFLSDIEAVFAELEGAGSYRPSIPVEHKYIATGGECSLVQAYVTWAQQETTPSIEFAVRGSPPASELVSRLPTIAAVLLSDNYRVPKGEPTSEAIKEAAELRLERLQDYEPQRGSRGPQVEIICADHRGRAYPVTFYDRPADGEPRIKAATALRNLARLILAETMPNETERGLTDDLVQPISEAVHELIRNTDEHARTDLAGNRLGRSLRLLQARRHLIGSEVLNRVAADTPAIHAYCQRLRPPGRGKQLQLIEISVLDSGPGLASRYANRAFERRDYDEELDCVRECFEKSTSSKPRSGAGLGLPNVIALLRRSNGFLRLRTGRQSLFADLGLEQGQDYGVAPNLQQLGTNRLTARASGTLFTLLFPVGGVRS